MSGTETSYASQQQPRWKITLEYEFLSEKQPPPPNEITDDPIYSDLDTILGFFCARLGANGTFLYPGRERRSTPRASGRQDQKLGVGDGVVTDFQLVRSIGEFLEVIQNPFGVPVIYVDGDPVDPPTSPTSATVSSDSPRARCGCCRHRRLQLRLPLQVR
jgi:hypothetical protein